MLGPSSGARPAQRLWTRLIATVLLLVATGAQSLPSESAPADELAEVRRRMVELEEQLRRTQRLEADAAGRLERTETERALQQERLREARLEREEAERELETSLEELRALESRLEESGALLARRLAVLYRLGRHGYARMLLSLDRAAESLPALRQMRYLARREQDALGDYRRLLVQAEEERGRIEGRRLAVEELETREADRLAALERLRREQEQVLAGLSDRRRRVSGEAARLLAQEEKLTLLLAHLSGDSVAFEGRSIQDFRGVLDWPSTGTVAVGFGPRRDPRYRTEVPHHGISLDTVESAAVRTVFPGRVVYAAPFEGYGLTVIVLHKERVFTLYSGLGKLSVARGDVLPFAGLVGSSAGHLYFEIRVENRPEDPQEWLR